MVEYAAGRRLADQRGLFAGLAAQLGDAFSERDCEVAARTGRLGTWSGWPSVASGRPVRRWRGCRRSRSG